MVESVDLNELKAETERAFRSGFMCSETAVYVLNKFFDLGMPESAMAMATGFPFGFGDGGNVCGGVAGATMCLGMVFGRTEPGDPKYKKCLDVVRELNDDVIADYDTTICPTLIQDYNFKDPDRKDHCVGIMMSVVTSFAEIMEREKGVKIIR